MNATRAAKNRIKLLGITEEDFRATLGLDADARIGAADVDAFEEKRADDLLSDNAAWESINFPVELLPMSYEKSSGTQAEVPGRRALVRTDTGDVLNVVSDRYKLVPHADLMIPMAQALKEMGLEVQREFSDISQNGAYVRYTWVLEDDPAEVAKGDRVQWAITGRNSYNYEAPFEIMFGGYRLVCENGLMVPVGTASRLGGKHRQGLDVDGAMLQVREFLAQRKEIMERWQSWDNQKLSTENFEKVLDGVSDFSKAAREAIMQRYQTNGQRLTLWTAYNAMTWYITHQVQTTADRDALVRDTLHRRALSAMGRAQKLAA